MEKRSGQYNFSRVRSRLSRASRAAVRATVAREGRGSTIRHRADRSRSSSAFATGADADADADARRVDAIARVRFVTHLEELHHRDGRHRKRPTRCAARRVHPRLELEGHFFLVLSRIRTRVYAMTHPRETTARITSIDRSRPVVDPLLVCPRPSTVPRRSTTVRQCAAVGRAR